MSTDIGIWIAALLTLAIYSFLYKDNPFYRFAECLLIGISVGFLLVVTVDTTLMPKAVNPLATSFMALFNGGPFLNFFLVLIPVILGLNDVRSFRAGAGLAFQNRDWLYISVLEQAHPYPPICNR